MPVAPKVSVLLPFRNPGEVLKDSICSILKQNFNAMELVLVNNNSEDQISLAIAKAFEQVHLNIRLLHENRTGITHALNKGLAFCKGEYIARMDADDISLPDRIRLQAEFLDLNPKIGLISGCVRFQSEISGSDGLRSYVDFSNTLVTENEISSFRFVESPFIHPSVMFRRSLLALHGNYSTLPVPEDFELWLRWYEKGVKMAKLRREVLIWNDHPDRLTRTHPNYSAAAFDQIRMAYLSRYLLKKRAQSETLPPIWIWGSGKLARRKSRILISLGINPEGFIDIVPEKVLWGKQVIHFRNIPVPGNIYIISLVSNRGKVKEIYQYLKSKGYESERDFILA